MPQLITIGETMAAFTPDSVGALRYVQNFGIRTAGAESNVAVGLAKLGLEAAWVSRLGTDEFGCFIRNQLRAEGVDCSRVIYDPDHRTGIMFKETGVGKALLADYQLPQLKALYYDGLYPLTEHTITDFRLLADQLAEIRASGFAYECEESTRGIRCIGVPLRKSGKVVAALSVAFPLERYSDAAAASARQALDEARRQIERMLCSVELQF